MNQEQMKAHFLPIINKNGAVYEKVGVISAHMANVPTKVVTTVGDGKETENTAMPGDYIVINPGGEKYVIPKTAFNEKYTPLEDFPPTVVQKYKPKGKVVGVKHEGDTFTYIAPWGSEAQCWKNGMVVTLYPFNADGEVYCIAPEEFKETYKEFHDK